MNLLDGIAAFFALPAVRAVLLVAVALVAATAARMLARRLVSGGRAAATLDRIDTTAGTERGSSQAYVGQLAFLAVLLLFVPGILTTLGVRASASPVITMLNDLWGFVPNLLGAGVILVVGMLVARVARQLSVPLFERLRVDALQERAGIKASGDARLSTTLGYAVYVLISVPVVIMALQVLGISAITDPAVNMLDQILGFVPRIVVAALMVAVGVFVARIAAQVVERLIATTGVDARAASALGGRGTLGELKVSAVAAGAVQAVIVVLFAVEALDLLELGVLAGIGTAIIAYLPSVLVAAGIVVAALVASGMLARVMDDAELGAYAPVMRVAVMAVAGFMALSQLGVAPLIVNTAFVALVAAAAGAGALAFGLGGREAAAGAIGQLREGAAKVVGDVRETVEQRGEANEPVADASGAWATVAGPNGSEREAQATPAGSSNDAPEKGLDLPDDALIDEGEGVDASREAWNPAFDGRDAYAPERRATHAGVDTASHSGA